jgi:aspartate 1-decarboxylase
MLVSLLKSKIHKARITQADLHYEGSLGIDQDIMDEVGLAPWERILVSNNSNGERLETYAIPAPRGSKVFLLNGAAARKGTVGDQIIIMSFAQIEADKAQDHLPKVIVLNEYNEIEVRKGALS